MNHTLVRIAALVTFAAAGCAVGSGADSSTGAGVGPVGTQTDAATPRPLGTAQDGGSTLPDVDAAADAAEPTDGAPLVDAATPVDSGPTGPCAFNGVLATYDFSRVVGTADLTASTTGGGVTASTLTRIGVTPVSSSNAMNASDWSLGDVDLGKAYVLQVTPPAGCSLKLTSLVIDLKASGTGPSSASVGTSADAYASLQTVAVSTAGGAANVPIVMGAPSSTMVEVHVLGYGASSSAGTMRVESTLSVKGQLSP